MVNKFIIIALLGLSLTACQVVPSKPVISYQQVDRVVYRMVEPPPTPQRPELEIERLTAIQLEDAGESVKGFVISTKQLQNHIKVLEELIEGVRKRAKEHNDTLTPNNLNTENSQ